MLAIERRNYILEKLQQGRLIKVTELSRELGVSRMTIHRDLDVMATSGAIEKVFGGAILTEPQEENPVAGECAMCGAAVDVRTKVSLQTTGGERLQACCSHCALLLIESRDDVMSGLATDFIHGAMINIKTATYLVNPDVVVCCTPTVLCFADERDAKRFQAGFGGELTHLAGAQKQIMSHMSIDS